MDVTLSPKLEALIRDKLQSGQYDSASEVVSEGLKLLEARDRQREARLQELRAQIQVGVDQAEAGNLSPLCADELIKKARNQMRRQAEGAD